MDMIGKNTLVLFGEVLVVAGIGLLVYGDWLNRVWRTQVESAIKARIPIMVAAHPPGNMYMIFGGAALIIGVLLAVYGFVTRKNKSATPPITQN
jgi:hypothetical protein